MTTILQISDPHLMSRIDGTLKNVPTWQSLQLVLQEARKVCPNPVRVVLTGDLSHEHTADGYQLLKDLLGDWTERALLIPGNHDDRREMRSVFSQVPGVADDDVWFCEELGDWQLIGLDSHVPGEVYGELSDDMLGKLQLCLADDTDRPTLIFLHHPPVSVNSAWLDKIGLRNPEALEKIVGNAPGVRGIFCGHIHQVFESRFADMPFYSAPSASFQFKPASATMEFEDLPPGFRVIELGGGTYETRVVRLSEIPFVPGDE